MTFLCLYRKLIREIKEEENSWKRLCSQVIPRVATSMEEGLGKDTPKYIRKISNELERIKENSKEASLVETFSMKEGFKPLRSFDDLANYLSRFHRNIQFPKFKASYLSKMKVSIVGENNNRVFYTKRYEGLDKKFTWRGISRILETQGKMDAFQASAYPNSFKSAYRTYLFYRSIIEASSGAWNKGERENIKTVLFSSGMGEVFDGIRRMQIICKKDFQKVENYVLSQIEMLKEDRKNFSTKNISTILHDFAVAFSTNSSDVNKKEHFTEGIILAIVGSEKVQGVSILKHNAVVDYVSLLNNYFRSVDAIRPIAGPYRNEMTGYKVGLLIKTLSYSDFKSLMEEELKIIGGIFLHAIGGADFASTSGRNISLINKFSGGILPFISTMADGANAFKQAGYEVIDAEKIQVGTFILKQLIGGSIEKSLPSVSKILFIEPEYIRNEILQGLGTKEKPGSANDPKKMFRELISAGFNLKNFKEADTFISEVNGKETILLSIVKNHMSHIDEYSYITARVENITEADYWFAGDYTVCCMAYGNDKQYDYMFQKGFSIINVHYKERVIANSVVWSANEGKILVLDNIEVAPNYKELSERGNSVLRAIQGVAEEMADKLSIGTIVVGGSHNDVKLNGYEKVNINNDTLEADNVIGNYYSDASNVAFVLKGDSGLLKKKNTR